MTADNVVAVIRPGEVGRRHLRVSDDEKVATSPVVGRRWHGVWVESRYAKAHELDAMRDLVERLAARGMDCAVESVWCNSKACLYTITLRPGIEGCWRCFEAEVRDWVDDQDVQAAIEGEQFSKDWIEPRWDPCLPPPPGAA